MKYNILFSDAVKPTTFGGGEKWILQAAKRLENKGHHCSFICRKNSLFQQKTHAETESQKEQEH